MTARRVYIAGPMRGHPLLNFPAFDYAARLIRSAGHIPISPAELDRLRGLDEHRYQTAESTEVFNAPSCELNHIIRIDLEHVLLADDVVVLPGAEQSSGATAERAVALWANKPVMTLDDWVQQYAPDAVDTPANSEVA